MIFKVSGSYPAPIQYIINYPVKKNAILDYIQFRSVHQIPGICSYPNKMIGPKFRQAKNNREFGKNALFYQIICKTATYLKVLQKYVSFITLTKNFAYIRDLFHLAHLHLLSLAQFSFVFIKVDFFSTLLSLSSLSPRTLSLVTMMPTLVLSIAIQIMFLDSRTSYYSSCVGFEAKSGGNTVKADFKRIDL